MRLEVLLVSSPASLSLLPSWVWHRAARNSGGSHHSAVSHSGLVILSLCYVVSGRFWSYGASGLLRRTQLSLGCVRTSLIDRRRTRWQESRCRVPRGGAVAHASAPRRERAAQYSVHKNCSLCDQQGDDLRALQYIRSSAVSLSTCRSVQLVQHFLSVCGRLGHGLRMLSSFRNCRSQYARFVSALRFILCSFLVSFSRSLPCFILFPFFSSCPLSLRVSVLDTGTGYCARKRGCDVVSRAGYSLSVRWKEE